MKSQQMMIGAVKALFIMDKKDLEVVLVPILQGVLEVNI